MSYNANNVARPETGDLQTNTTILDSYHNAVGGYDEVNQIFKMFRVDVDGNLVITEAGAGAGLAAHDGAGMYNNVGNQDFSVAFNDADSVTVTGPSFTPTANNVVMLERWTTAGVKTIVNTQAVVVTGAGPYVLTFANAETLVVTDSYRLTLAGPRKAYDITNDALKNLRQNPEWERETAPVDVMAATPYELTAAFADVTGEIDVQTYTTLTLYFNIDIGTSTDVEIRFLHLHTTAGSEYREINLDIGAPTAVLTTLNLNDIRLGANSDQLFKYNINVAGTSFVKVQAKDAANGTGQIDALEVVKKYGV